MSLRPAPFALAVLLGVSALAGSVPPPPTDELWAAHERQVEEREREITDPLRVGDWAAAETAARDAVKAGIERDDGVDLATALAYLAVAEEGEGHYDDAFWHWQEAVALGAGGDLSTFGAPARSLASAPLRKLDEIPAGLAVRREGDGGEPFVPARKLSGADAVLPATRRTYPRGIRVQAIVDAEGRLRQPVVISSTFPALTCVVLEAMHAWRFAPARSGGRPVASLYELRIPSSWPLEQLVDLSKSPLREPFDLLKAGRYAEAEKKVERVWKRALNGNEQTTAFFGIALTEKALAEAGLGRGDDAVCRYQAAQTLEPRLYGADLSAFGEAGSLLMRNPWVAAGSVARSGRHAPHPGAGGVTRPEVLKRKDPVFPEYARSVQLQGRVIVETVITETGTLRHPVLLDAGPSTGFDASVLDACCSWRFKPATWEGKPVKVYYTTTVNFKIGR
jgi:TonB family protein